MVIGLEIMLELKNQRFGNMQKGGQQGKGAEGGVERAADCTGQKGLWILLRMSWEGSSELWNILEA